MCPSATRFGNHCSRCLLKCKFQFVQWSLLPGKTALDCRPGAVIQSSFRKAAMSQTQCKQRQYHRFPFYKQGNCDEENIRKLIKVIKALRIKSLSANAPPHSRTRSCKLPVFIHPAGKFVTWCRRLTFKVCNFFPQIGSIPCSQINIIELKRKLEHFQHTAIFWQNKAQIGKSGDWKDNTDVLFYKKMQILWVPSPRCTSLLTATCISALIIIKGFCTALRTWHCWVLIQNKFWFLKTASKSQVELNAASRPNTPQRLKAN